MFSIILGEYGLVCSVSSSVSVDLWARCICAINVGRGQVIGKVDHSILLPTSQLTRRFDVKYYSTDIEIAFKQSCLTTLCDHTAAVLHP